MFRKFILTGMLTIALIMGIAMPLAAQGEKINWFCNDRYFKNVGRELVGMVRRPNDQIQIDNVALENIQSAGDPNIVEVGFDGAGMKAGTKIPLHKIVSGNSYTINFPSNGYSVEVTGTYTESGLTGKVIYLIRGPGKLVINTLYTKWPTSASIGFASNIWVYFDYNLYNLSVAEQFVDKYVVPVVNYNEVVKMYNNVKKTFTDYVAKTNRRDQCPENFGCLCKGDIAEHMVYSSGMAQSLVSGAIGALPLAVGAPVEAINESKKTKTSAVLVAAIGYHYGRYPNIGAFQDNYRNDSMILFSEADIPSAVASVGSSIQQEALMTSANWFIKQLSPKIATSIPGIGNAIGFAISGITKAIEQRRIGNRAKEYFSKLKK